MDLIPPESFLAILGHLSERDRLRVLRTCKRMRVWLQKRQSVAQAAFDAFKAQCVGWHPIDNLTVRTSGAFRHERGTRRWSCIVSLEDNSLISIVSSEHFTLNSGVSLRSQDVTRFFSPWFHTITLRQGRVTRTGVPADILQMLLSASPRLI